MKTILLIDDCIDYREVIASLLLDSGYDVWEAGSPAEAFSILDSEKFDLIVCDLHMPLTSDEDQSEFVHSYEVGVKTIQEFRDLFPKIPLIAMSSTPSEALKSISKYLDPVPAYSKPLHGEDVVAIIDSHLNDISLAILQ